MAEDMSLRLEFGRLEESSAVVRLAGASGVGLVSATLYGPQCEYARTLPAETRFQPGDADALNGHLVASVIDPCYWTPALPFLYQLKAVTCDGRGREVTRSLSLGLRRWTVSQDCVRLEGKRRVLRGAACEGIYADDLVEARAAESALLTAMPDADMLEMADRHGVPLIVDLRNSQDLVRDLDALSWHPAALLAVVDGDQRKFVRDVSTPTYLPLVGAADSNEQASSGPALLELGGDVRPPRWAATHAAPVLAVRRGGAWSTIREARAACDQLQAELAPDFDLAGYFVTVNGNH